MENSFAALIENSKQAVRYWWLLLLTGIALLVIGIVVFAFPAQSYIGRKAKGSTPPAIYSAS